MTDMRIETDRLILRPLTRDDASAVQKYFPHWEIVQHLASAIPWPYPPDGALQFIDNVVLPEMARGDTWSWALTLKDGAGEATGALPGEAIGVLDLRRHASAGNRGFWLGLPFQGRGYMTEAVTAVNDYAFDTLGFEKLTVKNVAGNEASRRVKQKTGCVFLHIEPNVQYMSGVHDQEVWELTADNWRRFRQVLRAG